MLHFVVLLSLLSVSFAEGDKKPTVRMPEAIRKVVIEAGSECVKETKVSQEISDNFFKTKFDNNNDMKKFMYCITRKTNYSDEDGHFADSVITMFEESDRKEEIQKVIDNCNNIKEKDHFETLFQTFLCFYNTSPVLLSV